MQHHGQCFRQRPRQSQLRSRGKWSTDVQMSSRSSEWASSRSPRPKHHCYFSNSSLMTTPMRTSSCPPTSPIFDMLDNFEHYQSENLEKDQWGHAMICDTGCGYEGTNRLSRKSHQNSFFFWLNQPIRLPQVCSEQVSLFRHKLRPYTFIPVF